MRITGLLPVRNEEWIIGFSLRTHLMWMDDVIVLNHASTDRTREILEEIQGEVGQDRLLIVDHPNPVWSDTGQRQRLLELGRQRDGELFTLFDADEVLTGNLLPDIRDIVGTLKPAECVTLPWIPIWKSIYRYRTHHATQGATIAFRDAPLLHWRSDQGYDQHRRHPYESIHIPQPEVSGGGMHFQFVDWRRIVAKHALYKMNELARFPGRKTAQEINRQYDATLEDSKAETASTPLEWFAPYRALIDHLRIDIEPWQEAECKRLWKIHGPRVFQGLNLYGLLPTGESVQPAIQAQPIQNTGNGSKRRMQQPTPVSHKMTLTEINRAKRLGLHKGVTA
jgi:hypothetical protein